MSLIIVKPDRNRYAGERLDPGALVVGDHVAWLTSGQLHGPEATLARVVRLTRTQIVVQTTRLNAEYRFDRSIGRMRGSGSWGAYLVHPNDPRVVRARVLGIARGVIRDIETMARAAEVKTMDGATGHLENVRTVVNSALDRMAKLLTASPDALIEDPS
jgi:hypothetical protein